MRTSGWNWPKRKNQSKTEPLVVLREIAERNCSNRIYWQKTATFQSLESPNIASLRIRRLRPKSCTFWSKIMFSFKKTALQFQERIIGTNVKADQPKTESPSIIQTEWSAWPGHKDQQNDGSSILVHFHTLVDERQMDVPVCVCVCVYVCLSLCLCDCFSCWYCRNPVKD